MLIFVAIKTNLSFPGIILMEIVEQKTKLLCIVKGRTLVFAPERIMKLFTIFDLCSSDGIF